MDRTSIYEIAIILALILANGLFAAAEIAVVKARRGHITIAAIILWPVIPRKSAA
jgi:CBS domain containing-hemolysin-like protein